MTTETGARLEVQREATGLVRLTAEYGGVKSYPTMYADEAFKLGEMLINAAVAQWDEELEAMAAVCSARDGCRHVRRMERPR
jgi:hypothetical protein